ncbi:MAG: sugar ABC transporter ATP-binding protein [Reinekea sp.]|jgi:galactofuranose transport system ATP-binding protein
MTEAANVLLRAEKLCKSFIGVKALDSVSLTIQAGEIHALLGENGAGKSTVIKVLTGVYERDSGQILLNGKSINPKNTGHAQALGISTVYQEVNLVPTLSVAENLTLQTQASRFGLISWKKSIKQAKNMLERIGLDIDPNRRLDTYSVAIQQMVAIARAVGSEQCKMLILDEPTASLDSQEIDQLFALMEQLKSQGIGIIFVTHFLDQVYRITDRITVLRNGQYIGTYETAELPRADLIQKMVGHAIEESGPARHVQSDQQQGDALLALQEFGKSRYLNPVSMQVNKGEIVGLAGLLGSGRTELCELAFSAQQADSGSRKIHGQAATFKSPRQAIRKGMAYCPEDRKRDGIIAELSVRENMILALQASKGWWKAITRAEQETLVNEMVKRLAIKTPDIEKPIGELSGGNQQKVILARWLITHPELLILDEPTRGIDVGAHQEIIQIMKQLCADGMGLMVASSELEELVAFAHRVVVMRDRNKAAELSGEDVSRDAIITAIAQ